jgi:hypothetical protein
MSSSKENIYGERIKFNKKRPEIISGPPLNFRPPIFTGGFGAEGSQIAPSILLQLFQLSTGIDIFFSLLHYKYPRR